jgi:predicted acyl esterase
LTSGTDSDWVVKLIDVHPDAVGGDAVMVQIQSSWFPLYDRDPPTFVANIFKAKAGDYRKAAQRIYHSARESSLIELPVAGR